MGLGIRLGSGLGLGTRLRFGFGSGSGFGLSGPGSGWRVARLLGLACLRLLLLEQPLHPPRLGWGRGRAGVL